MITAGERRADRGRVVDPTRRPPGARAGWFYVPPKATNEERAEIEALYARRAQYEAQKADGLGWLLAASVADRARAATGDVVQSTMTPSHAQRSGPPVGQEPVDQATYVEGLRELVTILPEEIAEREREIPVLTRKVDLLVIRERKLLDLAGRVHEGRREAYERELDDVQNLRADAELSLHDLRVSYEDSKETLDRTLELLRDIEAA